MDYSNPSVETTNLTYDTTYTTTADPAGLAGFGVFMFVYFALIVLIVASMWRIFTKAGKPGWAALIPIYNAYVLLQIVGRPGWWLLLYFVPLVNVVVSAIVAMDLAKAFGKSEAYGLVVLWLFSFIGYPLLAFGSDKYTPPAGTSATPTAPAAA